MEKLVEITICMGSSCFARGNNATRKIIENFLTNHKLNQKVIFKGYRCFDQCKNGPVIKVNERIYQNINQYNIIDILTENLPIELIK